MNDTLPPKDKSQAGIDLARLRQSQEDPLSKAQTLSEALPYLRRYNGASFVVKYGGNAMGDAEATARFARDIVLLKQVGINPIVVHGGGPQIGGMLERLQIPSQFVDGLRVTDKASVDVVEMVLSGSINKQIAAAITRAGGTAIGLSGKDGDLIRVRKLRRSHRDPDSNIERILDLGHVGDPDAIRTTILEDLMDVDMIPVVAPIGVGPDGETYNINADTVAGALAGALDAARLFLLTDISGVLDKDGRLIPEMNVAAARTAMADGTIHGGMLPKIETCIKAVEEGVDAAVILDGRLPHALFLEIFTESGAGTMIREQDQLKEQEL